MSQDVLQKGAAAINARVPIIAVNTLEERRARAYALAWSKSIGADVVLWSCVGGVDGKGKNNKPTQVLQWLRELKERTVVVLQDFEGFIDPSTPGTTERIRLLREIADEFQNRPANTPSPTIVLVGEDIKLPNTLAPMALVLDLPRPDYDQLRQQFELNLNAMKGVNWPEDRARFVDQLTEAARGLTMQEAENALAMSKVEGNLTPQAVAQYKRQLVTRSRLVDWLEPVGGLEMVGGLENAKRWFVQRTLGFTPEAREYGLAVPKGVVLCGLPGTGKSLIAKVVMKTLGMVGISVNMATLKDSLQGGTQKNVKNAFMLAEALAPCVLVLDEFDKAMGGMDSSSGVIDGGTGQDVLGMVLTWLQEKTKPVFCIASMNRTEGLPPELLRPGRWDASFFVDLPHVLEREAIWRIHISKRGRKWDTYDVAGLAVVSEGYTGAEIEVAVEEAMYTAFSDGQREFTNDDLRAALDGLTPQSKAEAEKISAMRSYAAGRMAPASDPYTNGPANSAGRFAAI